MKLRPQELLTALPEGLRAPLLKHYIEIARNFVERRWEPSELNAGKLCEVVYCILDGATGASFASPPTKRADMVAACRTLEQRLAVPGRVGGRSLRILIPRVLLGIYEVRNNRGVGHVAGDIDSNKMDATMVFACANWILCELVRIFHQVPLEFAQQAVSALVERRLPEIWQVGNQKRVLTSSLKAREQTLVLLYSEAEWVPAEDLRRWVEYKNAAQYRSKILLTLHKSRHIEFDQTGVRVQLSPKGAVEVEEKILPSPWSHAG